MLRTEQLRAVERMLDLHLPSSAERSYAPPWKVLVYDARCREILSPLLTLGDLRKRGITLHLLLDSARDPLPDVPAVYFVAPSAANLRLIGADVARRLYEAYHLNFTPSAPRAALEELAALTLQSGGAGHVRSVVDQLLDFVALDEDFFSLALRGDFAALHAPRSTDAAVEAAVERMVEGLFCALVTLGAVPILRFRRGGAAQMVGERLGARLHEQLREHPALFAEGGALVRPLLLLADRSLDVAAMLQHSWSYAALCHDLLDMHLNKVSIVEKTDQGPRQRTYDLQRSDSFWSEHMGAAFQLVAADVDKELSEYRAAMDEINRGGKQEVTDVNETTRALASTLDALPELQEKKRVIDAHMNIATELLGHIKSRSLDSYYAIEEGLIDGRSLSKEDKATLVQLLEGGGTAEDRLRLLLLLHLHPDGHAVSKEEMQKAEAALQAAGTDLRPLAWLRGVQQINEMQVSALQSQRSAEVGAGGLGVFSKAMKLADHVGVGSNARWVTSALAAGVKQLLPSRRATPLTRALAALMENKPSADDDAYAWIDPKASASHAPPRSRAPFTQAVVFVAGPGNYLEYLSVRHQLAAAAGGKKIAYGCAEVLTPRQFLDAVAQCA
ncbi:hypothetical protein AB1Y20_018475 [Prymnesium parvum]|uniref:Sec1 family domain-containing protein 1 n=1 Tax=Prymnesium parvum TaxID=97485 RepID=A0AB34JRU9_PRYPA